MAERRQLHLARLLGALRRSGYDVSDLKLGRTVDFELHDLERERRIPIRLGIVPLRRELLHPRSRRAFVAPPEPGTETLDLIIGYEPRIDTFVAWQPEAHPDEPTVVRVPTERLTEARGRGVDVDLQLSADPGTRDEIVAAFRPDRVRDYLEAVPDLGSLRRQLAQGGAEAVPEVRRAAFTALGSEPPPASVAALGVISAEQPHRPEHPEREVGTGFATPEGAALDRAEPLLPGERYLFWFKVGAPVPSSIEETRTELPLELLPAEAELDVVLFGFDGELELEAGAGIGGLRVDKEGRVRVCVPVEKAAAPDEELRSALFFPLRAPDREGAARLRCNVYCEGVLVQSRLVSARVAAAGTALRERGTVHRSTLEYSLSRSLHSAQLAKLPGADLSLMLNGDGESHQFRLYARGDGGEPAIASSATLEASDLTGPIEYCRAGLRLASWGTEAEWRERVDGPKYSGAGDPNRLASDLIELAVRGRNAYSAVAGKLVESREQERRLRRFRGNARVEIATSSGRFVPAALLYDAPLATGANRHELSLCEDFVEAREAPGMPLQDSPCFAGECPGWEQRTVVCPGGFWGFRHAIGWPVSLEDGDAPGVLAYEASLRAAMGSADDLAGAVRHRAAVEEVIAECGGGLDEVPTVARLLELLAARGEQLVYLYCHGGETRGKVPYVRIGAPEGPRLTRVEIDDLDLDGGNSLVFLNGCTTTALSPESRFGLVDSLIQYGGALGVIGTEITVFEPMAAPFGLDFLRAFVIEGRTVGEAVRLARLAALKRANPLGLAYVPFALGGLTLESAEGTKEGP